MGEDLRLEDQARLYEVGVEGVAMDNLSVMTRLFTFIEGGSEVGLFSSFLTIFQKALGSEVHRENWDLK